MVNWVEAETCVVCDDGHALARFARRGVSPING